MTRAQAISPHIARLLLPGMDASVGAWTCAAKVAPATPVTIVRVEIARTHADFTFDQATTPGALYALRHGDNEYLLRGYKSHQLAVRHLDVLRLLPAYIRTAEDGRDQQDFFACLQDVVDHLTMQIEGLGDDISPQTASPAALRALLADLGDPFSFAKTTDDARRLAPLLVQLYRQKGTTRGIRNATRLFLGVEISDVRARRRTADAPRSDLYTFDVYLSRRISSSEHKVARQVISYMKPAYAHLGEILSE